MLLGGEKMKWLRGVSDAGCGVESASMRVVKVTYCGSCKWSEGKKIEMREGD